VVYLTLKAVSCLFLLFFEQIHCKRKFKNSSEDENVSCPKFPHLFVMHLLILCRFLSCMLHVSMWGWFILFWMNLAFWEYNSRVSPHISCYPSLLDHFVGLFSSDQISKDSHKGPIISQPWPPKRTRSSHFVMRNLAVQCNQSKQCALENVKGALRLFAVFDFAHFAL